MLKSKPTPATTNPSLDVLALAAQSGDPSACEALLTALVPHVETTLSFMAQRPGFRGLVDADQQDLVQEIVITLWQKDLARFDASTGSFMAFARRRIRWMAAERVREHARFVDDDRVFDDMLDEMDPDACMQEGQREHMRRALPALVKARLPPQSRAIVTAVDLNGHSLVTAAKRQKMHVSRACRLKQDAHKTLALALMSAG